MVTRLKECYCRTCKKEFHYLGIAKHRAMHRDRYEDCVIVYTNGDIGRHEFSKWKPAGVGRHKAKT